MSTVIVKAEAVKKLRNQYPWLYADEIAELRGAPDAGALVALHDPRGDFIARAFFNPVSHIRARVLTQDPTEKIDRAFFETRLARAAAQRAHVIGATNAVRLVHAEADRLPGLIVDQFAEMLVVQFRNAGVEQFRKEIIQALKKTTGARGAYERSDTQARAEEGLREQVGELFGETPEEIEIFEDDVTYAVNPRAGQKTGFYLDQRDNRRLWRGLMKPDSRALDVFSYTGGFALHAAKAGAAALAVDKDSLALRQLEKNAARNGVSARVGARWGDAEKILAQLVAEGRAFSHIALDPPTLAKHKNDVPPAKQLFTRLCRDAFRLLDPAGVLLVSTCAYHIGVNDLIEVSRIAANEVGRRARVLTVTYQPADHPWILQIPETLYLKTLALRAD